MFKGRNLIIATKHNKEKVIAPILEKELGVNCIVDSNLDTDILGTFTGEIERKNDPITTARKKCLLAMELSNTDLGIASEGSFGPHPSLYFVPADDEFLIFIDKKNDLEIIVRELSTNTNFNGEEIKTEKELQTFAEKSNFPSHGLILRKDKDDFTEIEKGISSFEQLYRTFTYFINKYNKAYVETDMRAMFNPTRMSVIENATKKLVEKLNMHCPSCNTPGFGITNSKPGLPCQLCNMPTNGILAYIYSCNKCSYSMEEKIKNVRTTEDPMFCDFCNP